MLKEDDGNKHDKAKFIDSESVFPTGDTRLPKAFSIG